MKGRVERRGRAVSLTAIQQVRDPPRAYRRGAPEQRIIRQNASQRQSPGVLLPPRETEPRWLAQGKTISTQKGS